MRKCPTEKSAGMNRSILIVIVDFLLISLLAFARLDELDLKEEKANQAPSLASVAGNRQDLVDVLKVSLDKERESREQLNEQLRQTQSQLQSREQTLGQREQLIREAEQMLREKADQAARLERERTVLEQQFTATQSNITNLQKPT